MTNPTLIDLDAEFEEMMLGVEVPHLFPEMGTNPTDLPDWLTEGIKPPPPPPPPAGYVARHSTGRERCPWLDIEVPEATEHPGVEAAAVTAMLDLNVGFIKSPTAKHAHDGTALAMIDHAADVLRASLARRSVPRRVLRDLLGKLEAMVS